MTKLRILIVAEHASLSFGGEALLPFHYFRVLRARGVETWLLCHDRIAGELRAAFPRERDRLLFVPDSASQHVLWRYGDQRSRFLSTAIEAASHMVTQIEQRTIARAIVRDMKIDIVHEPIPVSPVQPSAMFDLGAPVIIGPMNGGLDYPDGFAEREGRAQRAGFKAARAVASALNVAMPGKPKASLLLVANERTRKALPLTVRHVPAIELVENGVDLARFSVRKQVRAHASPMRFAFVGRLINWKAVDLLLEAFARMAHAHDATLDVFGDGLERPALEALTARLGLTDRVTFHGFVAQSALPSRLVEMDALVLPSLRECGGAVVLEAMALGLPVIATDWGGPADYLDDECGILIKPESWDQLVVALASAMRTLAESPELCARLGARGYQKVRQRFDWERKVDRMIDLYESIARR
jgi:glycosyltransferase involved in cell wall biosynthesis